MIEHRVGRLAFLIALGGFLFGFDASVISGVVGYISSDFVLSDLQIGLVVGAPTIGGLIGGLLSGFIADAIGRKPVLIGLGCLYLVSAVMSAFAIGYEMLVVARAIGGLAFASLSIAPMYIAEIAPEKRRGFYVSFNQFAIVIGFSAAYFANYVLVFMSQTDAGWVQLLAIDTLTWRWMLGLEVIPATIWLVALLLIPETPRWLALNGREAEARQVLLTLQNSDTADATLAAIQASKNENSDLLAKLRELLSPALRVPFFIAISVGIVQQITGINAVFFYAPTIFEQSGVGTNAAFAQATWVGLTNVIFTVVAMLLIDRLGRKPLLIAGLSGIIVSMSLVSYGFGQATYTLTNDSLASIELDVQTKAPLGALVGTRFESDIAFKTAIGDALGERVARDNQSTIIASAISVNALLVLVGILGFVASFAVSLGPVMWVLFSEVFPNRIRGIAIGVATVFNSSASFLVQFLFPWQINALGTSTTFALFALVGAVGMIVIWRLPETKGESLERLEQKLA